MEANRHWPWSIPLLAVAALPLVSGCMDTAGPDDGAVPAARALDTRCAPGALHCPPPPPAPGCEATQLPDGTSCWRCEGAEDWDCDEGWKCTPQPDGCWTCWRGNEGKHVCEQPTCEPVTLPDGMTCTSCAAPDGTASLDCPDGWQCRRVGDSPDGGACYSCYRPETGEYKYLCQQPPPACELLPIPDPEIQCWQCIDPGTGQATTSCNDGWTCESLDHRPGCWACHNEWTGENRAMCDVPEDPVCRPVPLPVGRDCQECTQGGQSWYECADGTECYRDDQGCWNCANPRTGQGWGWCDGGSPPDQPVPSPL